MSIKIMTAVWPRQLPAFDKLVLLALADAADDEGRCFPSMGKLMEKCGMSDRTVQRSINRLQEKGFVERQIRDGRSSIYRVTPDPRPIDTPSIGHPVSLSPTPVSLSPPEKKKTSSLEPSLNRQRARAPVSDEPPPSNLNVEAWHRWEQYRRQIRKPIQPVSTPAAQRKLAAFGTDQAAVVEQSIANGWQGLFALKAEFSRPREASVWR